MLETKDSHYNREDYTDEAKRKRFVKVAERRVNRLLNDLRLLGNVSNRGLYKYSSSDVEKIFREVDSKLTEVKTKFMSKHSRPFKLEERSND